MPDVQSPQRFIIYCHTNKVNGKQYVGITKYSMKHRWSGHVHAALKRKDDWAFCNAIRKYGRDGFTHEVLDVVATKKGAKIAERAWIEQKQSRAPGGYNLSSGGEYPELHTSTRKKISASWCDPAKKAQRLKNIRKAWANPDIRKSVSEKTARRMAAMSTEERAALNQKISERVRAGLPPIDDEWRRVRGEGSKVAWAHRSKEERDRITAPMRAAQTFEDRRELARRLNNLNAQRTPEERRALALKAWETKRARYKGEGLYPRRCRLCGKFGHYKTSCNKRIS